MILYILVGLRVKWKIYIYIYTSSVASNKLPVCIQEIQVDHIFRRIIFKDFLKK